jgi:Domain of unknown function (DUF4190)
MVVPQPSETPPGGTSVPHPPETSLLAVVSLVAGILGLVGAFIAPLLASIVAIVCGHIARSRIARDRAQLTGDGLAIVGLVLGYTGIALSLIGVIFWGAMFGVGLRILYDIWQQIQSDTGGWSEGLSVIRWFV